jgi:hypothetical protein
MTTRLPCSLRARLALGISISTMARARRSLSALSWPLVNGMAGTGRFGPAGSGGGAVSFVVLLGGLMRIRRPQLWTRAVVRATMRRRVRGVPPAPSVCAKRRERAAKTSRNRWVSSERLSHHRIMREVSLFEHPHSGAHAGIRDGRRPAPAISGQKPANTRHSWEDALHDWRPKPPFRQGPPSLGRGQRAARFAYFAAKARSRPRRRCLSIVQTAIASTDGSSFSPLATMSSIPSGNGR